MKPFQSQAGAARDAGSFTEQVSEPGADAPLLCEYRTMDLKRSCVSSAQSPDLLGFKSPKRTKKFEEDGEMGSSPGSPRENTARGSIDHVIMNERASSQDVCNKVEFASSSTSNVEDE